MNFHCVELLGEQACECKQIVGESIEILDYRRRDVGFLLRELDGEPFGSSADTSGNVALRHGGVSAWQDKCGQWR